MGDIIKLAAWVELKSLSRGRVPLMDTHLPPDDSLSDRIQRIKESLNKINTLMQELKEPKRLGEGGEDAKP